MSRRAIATLSSGIALAFSSTAGLILLFGAPFRWLAVRQGWKTGEGLPVLFHRALCAGLGVRIRVHGQAASMRPQLVVSNHISWLDIPILGSMRPTEFLAKKEIGPGPLARAFLALQGGVALVDPDPGVNGIPAVNAEIAGRRYAMARLVILFAEATTGDANRILRFRSSHFEAVRQTLGAGRAGHAIVQPIFIAYSRRAGLPLGRSERPIVAWYGDMQFFDHLWRLLAAGRIDCDILRRADPVFPQFRS